VAAQSTGPAAPRLHEAVMPYFAHGRSDGQITQRAIGIVKLSNRLNSLASRAEIAASTTNP